MRWTFLATLRQTQTNIMITLLLLASRPYSPQTQLTLHHSEASFVNLRAQHLCNKASGTPLLVYPNNTSPQQRGDSSRKARQNFISLQKQRWKSRSEWPYVVWSSKTLFYPKPVTRTIRGPVVQVMRSHLAIVRTYTATMRTDAN